MLYTAKSHIGLVRGMNEDCFAVRMQDGFIQFMVIADGMGGASAGEVASKLAADTVAEQVQAAMTGDPALTSPQNVLRDAIHAANRKIWQTAQTSEAYIGMGTTVIAALYVEGFMYLGHVGDSRAYLLHGQELQQVTRDHSLVAELVRRGQLTEEEAQTHPQRHIVTRSLGTAESTEPDLIELEFAPNDVLMLCTDGLSNLVTTHEFANQLRICQEAKCHSDIESVADGLIRLALERGGPDNITVAIIANREGANLG